MNGILGLIVALLLPGLLGFAWLHRFWRSGHPAARLGYGYLLGVLITVLVIQAWSYAGQSIRFLPLALILSALALFPFLFRFRSQPAAPPVPKPDTTWQAGIWWFFLGILLIRFSGLLLEETLLPLYPWDAWMNWAPKAKVWFSLKELAPFVPYREWPEQSLQLGAYTLGNPAASEYPPLVPLIQFWTALGLGEWRDNWINLPWGLCAIAFFFLFYGQLRALGIPPVVVMVASYLLFSMPYLNTHVALAGYADLWMAAYYSAAVLALLHWSLTGSRTQLGLALLMAFAGALTKRPGIIWAATLLPGLLLSLLPLRFRPLFLCILVAAIALFWFYGGIAWESSTGQQWILTPERIQIPGLGGFTLTYHPVGSYFIKNDLLWDNWHLLGWLLLFSLPISLLYGLLNPRLLPITTTLLSGLVFLFVVFFFTRHDQSAIDSTTINRATFHILPALFTFILVSGWTWRKQRNIQFKTAGE